MTQITSPVPQNNVAVASQENVTTNLLTEIKTLLNGGVDLDNLTDALEALVTPPIVTSLPATPADGQRVLFRAAPGLLWQLRFNSGMSGSYKWECIGGGGPLESGAFSGAASAGNNTLAPITVPLPGVYVVQGDLSNGNGGADGALALRVTTTTGPFTLLYQYTNTRGAYLSSYATALILPSGAQNMVAARDASGAIERSVWSIAPKYVGPA